MKRTIISLLSGMLLFAACTNEMTGPQAGIESGTQKEVVLQERASYLPTEWTVKKNSKPATRSVQSVEEYIGRSYDIGNTILGDPDNVRLPVLDYEKIKSRVISDFAGTTEIASYAYADYDRYEENVLETKEIISGFSINLLIFKFGREKKTTETFKTQTIDENRQVFGEVDVEVRDQAYQISTTSATLKNLAANALSEDFKFDLYFAPMVEVLNNYGPFVITGYYSGGRATAMYYGYSSENTTAENREKDLSKDINASFAWGSQKKDSLKSVGLDFGFGTDNGNSEAYERSLEEVYMQVKTQGGNKNLQCNTNAGEVGTMSVDLSSWLSSLDDQSTHTLIGIRDGGLTGLNSFMLEENFSRRMQDTHLGHLNVDAFLEPYIEIGRVYVRATSSGEKLYKIAPILNTRQGDKIVLNSDGDAQLTDEELRKNNDNDYFMTQSQAIAAEKGQYYKCAITANPNLRVMPLVRVPLCIELDEINENRMCKFFNEENNMWYIYDPVALTAYSFYLDDFVLDMYGMREWVESLPTKSISMVNLYMRYTIIGL